MSAKKFHSILTSKFQINKEHKSPKFDHYLSFHLCNGILSLVCWSKGDKPKSLRSFWHPICYNFGCKNRNSATLSKARIIIQRDDTEWINVGAFHRLYLQELARSWKMPLTVLSLWWRRTALKKHRATKLHGCK